MRPTLLFLLGLSQITLAQSPTFNPDDILIAGDSLPKILLVGTFHFDYPGLDDHKIDNDDRIDVATEEKQAEVLELVEYISRFRPNKIVVEQRAGSKVNETYRDYLVGNYELERDEIEQIAFRLGKRFGVDTLIPGDDRPLSNSLYNHQDSVVLRPIIDSLFSDTTSIDPTIGRRYEAMYTAMDSLTARHRLLDVFRLKNDPHMIRRGHGHYLEFASRADADALTVWWYSRNLRIYHRIRRETTSPEDRILVLFGSGHLGILRQQFESSPAYELVEFGEL